jgi:hypothetical protein
VSQVQGLEQHEKPPCFPLLIILREAWQALLPRRGTANHATQNIKDSAVHKPVTAAGAPGELVPAPRGDESSRSVDSQGAADAADKVCEDGAVAQAGAPVVLGGATASGATARPMAWATATVHHSGVHHPRGATKSGAPTTVPPASPGVEGLAQETVAGVGEESADDQPCKTRTLPGAGVEAPGETLPFRNVEPSVPPLSFTQQFSELAMVVDETACARTAIGAGITSSLAAMRRVPMGQPASTPPSPTEAADSKIPTPGGHPTDQTLAGNQVAIGSGLTAPHDAMGEQQGVFSPAPTLSPPSAEPKPVVGPASHPAPQDAQNSCAALEAMVEMKLHAMLAEAAAYKRSPPRPAAPCALTICLGAIQREATAITRTALQVAIMQAGTTLSAARRSGPDGHQAIPSPTTPKATVLPQEEVLGEATPASTTTPTAVTIDDTAAPPTAAIGSPGEAIPNPNAIQPQAVVQGTHPWVRKPGKRVEATLALAIATVRAGGNAAGGNGQVAVARVTGGGVTGVATARDDLAVNAAVDVPVSARLSSVRSRGIGSRLVIAGLRRIITAPLRELSRRIPRGVIRLRRPRPPTPPVPAIAKPSATAGAIVGATTGGEPSGPRKRPALHQSMDTLGQLVELLEETVDDLEIRNIHVNRSKGGAIRRQTYGGRMPWAVATVTRSTGEVAGEMAKQSVMQALGVGDVGHKVKEAALGVLSEALGVLSEEANEGLLVIASRLQTVAERFRAVMLTAHSGGVAGSGTIGTGSTDVPVAGSAPAPAPASRPAPATAGADGGPPVAVDDVADLDIKNLPKDPAKLTELVTKLRKEVRGSP